MTVTTMFHLGVNKEQLQGATLAIIPGDPARVAKIAEQLAEPVFLNTHREFTLYLGKINGQSVVVCSTGIGGPSTSIAVEELAQLGVTSFLRVGTTGAIQPDITIGDMIVTTAAVRLDGASHHFAPIEFPAVADFEMVSAIKQAALNDGLRVRLGITASSDTFYPGQERYDTVTGRVLSTFQGSMKQWQEMGVLNYEMESATLFTQCASSGLQAACVAGVLINRCNLQEIPSHETAVAVEAATISLAVRAATIWLNAR